MSDRPIRTIAEGLAIGLALMGGALAGAPAAHGASTSDANPSASQVRRPAAPTTARAAAVAPVTVSLRLRFFDEEEGRTRPLAGVPVEIWTFAPRLLAWTWAPAKTGTTDSRGRFSTSLPFRNRNVRYAVRVLTRNDAAHCCAGWAPAGFPAGTNVLALGADRPAGKSVELTAPAPGSTVSFDWTVRGGWASVFNVLDVLRHAAAFVRRYETDVNDDRIKRVGIGSAADISWWDPVMSTINLSGRARWQDRTILHEYGHYVEAEIGSLAWIASNHSGCTPGAMYVFGGTIGGTPNILSWWKNGANAPREVRAQHAWLEGFADWLAEAVYWDHPAYYASRAATVSPLENTSCGDSGPWPDGDRFENHVAAFLWDMTDPASAGEPDDLDGGPAQVAAVIRAMDRELDHGSWPAIDGLTSLYVTNPADFPAASAMENAFRNEVSYIVLN